MGGRRPLASEVDLTAALEAGLDLIRRGEYFAAHEELEDAWRAAPEEERDFFQGLVHVAVAWYQAGRDNRVGCERQLEKAARRLGPYAPEHRGVDVASLLAQVEKAVRIVATDSLELPRPQRLTREKETRNPFLTEYARFGVARALRALGRPAEAIPYLEQAIEWCEEQQLDSPYVNQFHEELAAAYDDAGRSADAAACGQSTDENPPDEGRVFTTSYPGTRAISPGGSSSTWWSGYASATSRSTSSGRAPTATTG